jgi:hypothetical protein
MRTPSFCSRFTVLSLFGSIVVGCNSLHAANIPIANNSFEIPALAPDGFTQYPTAVPGWTSLSLGSNFDGVGVEYPVVLAAPDGNQSAYINNAAGLSQVLTGVELAPDTTYTLSAWLAALTPTYPPGTDYSVSLLAGSTVLASVVPVALNDTSWQDLTATYTTTGTVLPGDLQIQIEDLDLNSAQPGQSPSSIDVDDVTLTATPVSTPAPDAGSALGLLTLSVSGLAILRRRFAK